MTDNKTSDGVGDRMSQLVYLVAQQSLFIALKDATQREKIGFLKKAGLSHEDVAMLLGTTVRVVTVELSSLRKGKVKKANGKKSKS